MDIVRKIVQQELRRMLSEAHASTFPVSGVEEIIYDFEIGRAFGINKLSVDIPGLSQYYMNSYFPISEMEENWMFEVESSFGAFQNIEVTHKVTPEGESYWRLDISEAENNSDTPSITHSTGFIRGYSNFIQRASTIESLIDSQMF